MQSSLLNKLGKLPRLALLASVTLIASCGIDISGNTDSATVDGGSCELSAVRQWIYDNMTDYYLFADQVQNANLESYTDLQALVSDLRVGPFDRFSYISDADSSNAYFNEGELFGFGWLLSRTSDQDVQFTVINPGSPIAAFDVQRGDYLREINGVSMNSITESQLNNFLGTGTTVVSPTLTIQRGTDPTFEVTVTKATFTQQTVLDTRVVEDNNQRIGYLHFLSFLAPSAAELDTAFDTLKAENIDELVLDLRHNGGGRINIANQLASQIGGNMVQDQNFASFQYNQQYSQYNENSPFIEKTNALNLSRVFVLTSQSTCSASEMVINGLRPFVDVITVGDTTCGKPYGSNSDEACGLALYAIRVSFVNADGTGDYYNGLDATCPANDDLSAPLGTPAEPLLSSALQYIRTGSCATVAYRNKPALPAYNYPSPLQAEKRGILR